MTDTTPPIPSEDTGFLDDILSWSEASIGQIEKEKFAQVYLPNLVSDDEVIRKNAWRAWEADVAGGYSTPVYVLDESGNPKWLVPPIMGTINSGYTANPMSVNTQNQMVATIRNRLVASGEAAQEKMFEGIANSEGTETDINRFYQINWFVILRDFGYLRDEKGALVNSHADVAVSPQTVELYTEGDYDI